MSKLFVTIEHPDYACNVCGGAISYDTLDEATSRIDDESGIVIEVASVHVWRIVDGKKVLVEVDANTYFEGKNDE